MSKKMLIDATHAEETRVVVVEGNKVDQFDFESLQKRQLAGNIYLAKVTRVEPSLQAAFVDYGGNRHGFLAFNEIHPDYYQIPVADREQLLAEEEAYAKSQAEEAERQEAERQKRRSKRKKAAAIEAAKEDEVISGDVIIDEADGEEDTGLVDVPEAQGEDDAPTSEEAPSEESVEVEIDASEAESASDDDETSDDDSDDKKELSDATDKDDSIESVADEDVEEEVRPRKPRPRRYKIQEVVKVRQILLIQVVKEERGNKGAAVTTYLSLAGRYCVLMPNTARGGGISRKIVNAQDRKKIKEITSELEVPKGAGLIVRTAGAKRSKTDITRDYEYLLRLWEQIRETTMDSTAPAQIYAEGDLIKRSIRDLYSTEIDEIIVEGERGHEAAKAYMQMLSPGHEDRVKSYSDRIPLFSRYQVESYLGGMFNPTVQLKSGGYIVIGVTEALVAIDVNSGKATKESSIEKTALKTNLEAAEEVARQLRLRDLAGLIVIDFIDMEERRNNNSVEKRLKDALKNDRARIQVGRISGFGLLEMSRQRLRPGMLEATTQPCPHCHGTGLLRSDDSQALSILREIEEEAVRRRSKEVVIRAPVNIANYLMNRKRANITAIEEQYGLSVLIEADATLLGTDFELEKRKTASKFLPDPIDLPEPIDMSDFSMDEEEEEKPKKKRRRRRRRGGKKDQTEGEVAADASEGADAPDADAEAPSEDEIPKKPRRSRKKKEEDAPSEDAAPAEAEVEEKPKRRTRKKKEDAEAEAEAPAKEEKPKRTRAKKAETEEVKEDKPKRRTRKKKEEPEAEAPKEAEAEEKPKRGRPKKAKGEEAPEVKEEAAEPAEDKPKRKGWWSR